MVSEHISSRAANLLQKQAMERFSQLTKEHPDFPAYYFSRISERVPPHADAAAIDAFNDDFSVRYGSSRGLTRAAISQLSTIFSENSNLIKVIDDKQAAEHALTKAKRLGF